MDAASDATVYRTLSAACDALAQARVDFATECGGSSTDATVFAAQCRNEGSATGSGQTIASVLACAASFHARTSCKVTTVDPSCGPTGTIASGGACSYDTQCADGACAITSYGSCGSCTTPGAVGDACTGRACAASLQCTGTGANRRCAQPVADGATCNTTDKPCATGACVHGTCTTYSGIGPTVYDDSGIRQPCAIGADFIGYGATRCVLPAPEGGSCDISNVEANGYQTCAAGLYCASAPTDGGTTAPGTCRKPAAVGAACEHQVYGGYLPVKLHPLPSACATGGVCTATTSTTGTCVPTAALGSPCVGGGQCGDHERCNYDPPHRTDGGICVAAGTLGNVCIYYLTCDPGLACDTSTAIDGICRALPAAGSPCIANACAADATCNTTTSKCKVLPHAGQPCVSSHCSADAYCDTSAPGGALCRALAVLGDPCDDPTDRRYCPTGAYCQHADGGTVGTCVALPTVGASCGFSPTSQTSSTCADSVQCLPADDAGTAYHCAYACAP